MNEPMTLCEKPEATGHVWQPSRQQSAYRQLMTAFSYPGRVVPLTSGAESARMLVLTTLVDSACTLADPQRTLSQDALRRLGSRAVSVETAEFVLVDGQRLLEAAPRLGSLESPEQGATVVMRVSGFGAGGDLYLAGPGIQREQVLRVEGIDPGWWDRRSDWNSHFPLGVDFILVAAHEVAVLPRTTRILFKGAH